MTAAILLALLAFQQPALQVTNNEIWVMGEGRASAQLTNDGLPKRDPKWSPDGSKIAYASLCREAKSGCPQVIVISPDGTRLTELPGVDLGNSIDGFDWLSNERIGIDAHVNPSLGEYRIVDLSTARVVANYLGFWFTPSPDRKWIAHVGFMPHFAPQYAHNYYLQIDGKTIYPSGLKAGDEFSARTDSRDSFLFRDIREFRSLLVWSPDSKRIALIERMFDFHVDKADPNYQAGEERNPRFALIVVTTGGKTVRRALKPFEGRAEVKWVSAGSVQITAGEHTTTFPIE